MSGDQLNLDAQRSRLLAVIDGPIPVGDLGALSAKYPGSRISMGRAGGLWVRTEGRDCDCHRCEAALSGEYRELTGEWLSQFFIVCPDCGNKRCPKATFHGRPCTGSNEPGQIGSDYA